MKTTTTKPSKPAKKAAKPVTRTIKWIKRMGEKFVTGCLQITVDGDAQLYLATEVIAEDGRAIELVGAGAEQRYECYIANNGQDDRCSCPGFRSHGHCKHLASLIALMAKDALGD